jgi:S-methylmethionine-dependent homocysteine/selenocysteine methylase
MEQLIANNDLILMEAAIVEPLRRSDKVELHPSLVNAPLIYDASSKLALGNIYESYIDIARNAKLPFLMCTPTWRANRERVVAAGVPSQINIDAVNFLQEIRQGQQQDAGNTKQEIKIGGMIGCKNDAYQPELGLSAIAAEQFHQWQVDQLTSAGVDYLITVTLPNIDEAIGIAQAMSKTDVPYIISFVISRDGNILDGTSLSDAIEFLDSQTSRNPVGYMVNCAYPSFLCAQDQPATLFKRLIGIQANASSLDHDQLDEAEALHTDDIEDWGNEMVLLNKTYGMKILGGCCGTGPEHLEYILSQS